MYTIPTTDPLGPLGLRIHDLITTTPAATRAPARQVDPAHDFLVLAPCPALTADLLYRAGSAIVTALGER